MTSVLEIIAKHKIVAIVRLDDLSTAKFITDALIEGGIRAIEFTLTNPRRRSHHQRNAGRRGWRDRHRRRFSPYGGASGASGASRRAIHRLAGVQARGDRRLSRAGPAHHAGRLHAQRNPASLGMGARARSRSSPPITWDRAISKMCWRRFRICAWCRPAASTGTICVTGWITALSPWASARR